MPLQRPHISFPPTPSAKHSGHTHKNGFLPNCQLCHLLRLEHQAGLFPSHSSLARIKALEAKLYPQQHQQNLTWACKGLTDWLCHCNRNDVAQGETESMTFFHRVGRSEGTGSVKPAARSMIHTWAADLEGPHLAELSHTSNKLLCPVALPREVVSCLRVCLHCSQSWDCAMGRCS